MEKTIFITGASSGFGKLIAKKFHKEGWNVIATMRNPKKESELINLKNILITKLDVTDKISIENSVKEGIERFGKIDVLVNNAGYGLQGPFMTTSEEMNRKLMNVNVFGLFDVTKTILPHFEKTRDGIIINFSSLAGLIGFPHTSVYNAAKFAVEGFTEALQYELNPLGIKLKLIEPGAFNTGFASAIESPEVSEKCIYRKGWDATVNQMITMMRSGQNPQEVADITFLAATDGTNNLRYLVGNDAIQIMKNRKQMDDLKLKNMIKKEFKLI